MEAAIPTERGGGPRSSSHRGHREGHARVRPKSGRDTEAELGKSKSGGDEEFHLPVSWGGLEVIETLAMVFNDSKMQPCLNGGKASRVLYQGPTVSLSTPSLPLPLPRVTCMRQM